MRYVCALLTVEDMPTARAFYEGLLGQQVEHDFGENVQFVGGCAPTGWTRPERRARAVVLG